MKIILSFIFLLLFCISFGQNANDISKQIQSVKYSISELNKNYQIQTDEYKKSLNELEKELEEKENEIIIIKGKLK